jgi:transposase InsO family protein
MRNLPTEQKPHTHNKNPTLQNHHAREHSPFHTDHDGLDHRTPLITGIQHNIDYCIHGCSRGAIFLPCKTTITRPQIAQLYYEHVYPWFRLPTKVISNRDPRFTSHFRRALAKELGIMWNMSMAYHPQTDGLTEHKNQWIGQYLQLVAGNNNEWSTLPPMAMLVHNNVTNSTTRLAPNQLLTGRELPPTPAQEKDQITPWWNNESEN